MSFQTPTFQPSGEPHFSPMSPADPSRLRARFLEEGARVGEVNKEAQRGVSGVMQWGRKISSADHVQLILEDRVAALRQFEKSSDALGVFAGFIRKASASSISGIITRDFLAMYYEQELRENPTMNVQERMIQEVNDQSFQGYLCWAMNAFIEIFTPEYWDAFAIKYSKNGAYSRAQVGFALREYFEQRATKIKVSDGKIVDEYYWENICRIIRTLEVEFENRERSKIN